MHSMIQSIRSKWIRERVFVLSGITILLILFTLGIGMSNRAMIIACFGLLILAGISCAIMAIRMKD